MIPINTGRALPYVECLTQDREDMDLFADRALMAPVLVAEPNEEDRIFFVSALVSAGVQVIGTDNFASARACLEAQPAPLLVTELQLGTYSGMCLALLGRHICPGLSLVMTSRFHDPDLQHRGQELGAVFIRKPMTQEAFLAAVLHATLHELTKDETAAPIDPCQGDDEYREIVLDHPALLERRDRRRRRDIATFLLLEGLRR